MSSKRKISEMIATRMRAILENAGIPINTDTMCAAFLGGVLWGNMAMDDLERMAAGAVPQEILDTCKERRRQTTLSIEEAIELVRRSRCEEKGG